MIIAGELDLTVPAMDIDAVKNFILLTKEMHDNSVAAAEEKIYVERNQRPYPWDRRILERDSKTYWRYNQLEVFKPILPLLDQLPLNTKHRSIIMIYQENYVDYDFNYHFDNVAGIGFRICFNLDTDKTFVQLSQLKEEFVKHGRTKNKIEDDMVEGDVTDLVPSKPNTVFFLNGTNFPHRVPVLPHTGPRLVLIVMGLPTFNFNNLKWLQKFEKDVL